MKQILKNKKDLIVFILIFIISLAIFSPFLKVHYSTDSYYIANKGYKNYAINNSLKDGRVFMAAIGYIAHLFRIPIGAYIIILTVLALFTSCVTIMALKNIILNYKNTKSFLVESVVAFISYFTIFNFMFLENMVFVECFVMSISILFYLLAAKELVNKNARYYFIKTILFLVLGILSYQGTISMYLISILVFSLIKNQSFKAIIKDLILGGIIGILGVSVQLIIISCNEKIFDIQQIRASEMKNFLSNIAKTIIRLPKVIINTGYIYPRGLYIIFVLILEILIFIQAYKEKKTKTFLFKELLIICSSIVFSLVVSFVSLSGFWKARIRYSIGTTIGFLLLYLFYETNLLDNIKIRINKLILFTFVLYSLSIVINYVGIMNNTLEVNLKDKELAIEILQYVEEYEQKNNINVNKLAVLMGPFENKTYYKELKYNGSVLSWSSIRTKWSIEGTLEMYSNRDLELVEITEDKLKYYINNVDRDKEYMCIDNTLYVSYYVD